MSTPLMTDSGAMHSIVTLLDGKEWDSEDLETVAEFCRLAGYRIDPPSDMYEVTYSETIIVSVPWTENIEAVAHEAMPSFTAWTDMNMTYQRVTEGDRELTDHNCPDCMGHREDEAT